MTPWPCPHCRHVNTWRATLCAGCGWERLGGLAWTPARPDAPAVVLEFTPEEHAEIRKQLARFRALLQLPPRPDTPPEPAPEPPPAPEPAAPTPVRVLARRALPPKPGWWRTEAS